jgi:chemotaxis protein MotB
MPPRRSAVPAISTPVRTTNEQGGTMKISRHYRHVLAALMPIALLTGCVSAQKYDALDAQYQQLNTTMSAEIAANQVHISRLQGAIKVTVNSELLFPSGGWQMPPAAQQTIARIAPILAQQIQEHIVVNGYTDTTPIGPELAAQGVTTNVILSEKRANTVMQFLISQGVNPAMLSEQGFGDANPVASNDTPQGRALNRRVELTLAR